MVPQTISTPQTISAPQPEKLADEILNTPLGVALAQHFNSFSDLTKPSPVNTTTASNLKEVA